MKLVSIDSIQYNISYRGILLVIWNFLEYAQFSKYKTGHLLKLSKCQNLNIRQSFKMNWAIAHAFEFQGSGAFFVKKLSSPKVFIQENVWVWDPVIEMLAMFYSLQKITYHIFCQKITYSMIFQAQNFAIFKDD